MPFAPARESRPYGSGQVNTQGMPRTNANTRFFPGPSTGAGTRVQSAPQNGGGWWRIDQTTPGSRAAAVTPNRSGVNQGFNQQGFSQQGFNQQQGFRQGAVNNTPRLVQNYAPSNTPREPQPVRISPPIVNNRNESGFGAARGNGFGGPRANGGGFNAPAAPPASREFQPARPQQGGGESRGSGGGSPRGGGQSGGGGRNSGRR